MGTRPEAIKLAPLIKMLKNTTLLETYVCATGQHGDMLKQVLVDFNIEFDTNLDIMQPNQTLAGLSAKLFETIDIVMEREKPDWVLVQGDTTTAMIGSICAYYRKIKVGHVEAGLRSNDFWIPFPEEFNRRTIKLVTQKHFAPTQQAKDNLLGEDVPEKDILLTGNTVIDALLWMVKNVRKTPPKFSGDLYRLIAENHKYVLITGHRRESFGKAFENICEAVKELAQLHKYFYFVYPVHLNPNVRKPVN